MKKIISILLTIFLIFSFTGVFASDTFCYDGITRGEFSALINRILKFDFSEKSTFDNMTFDTTHILGLNRQGIISAFENKIRPNDFIPKEEAAVILYKALNLKSQNSFNTEEKDAMPEENFEFSFEGSPDDEFAEEVPEEIKPTIETTLKDGMVQKNSKMVFDVIARDVNGEKAECRVKCNDTDIEPSWDDESKTSYTLEFIENGEYTVEITATDLNGISQTVSYLITYEMAEYGEVIGRATVCVEAFTIGGGYIVAPVEVDISEGVNCAYVLDELLSSNGMSYVNTGSLDGGFYLASICDVPEFTPAVSETMASALEEAGVTLDTEMCTPNQLSEFDFTQGSGWMYCVNDIFPNVGFSEYYLQDGDVLRVQFTLAYGSDIGGSNGAGYDYTTDFFEFVNRDELTQKIALNGTEAFEEYMDLITKPDLTSDELDRLLNL